MGRPLGQHFLRDTRVLDAILTAAELRPTDRVLEIGPGPGNLTERLATAVPDGTVVAIEADRALAAALRGRWPNVTIHHGDAVQTDLAHLGPFDAIIANLPYLISGPITVAFLDLLRPGVPPWRRAVLMYQKEFADRLLASPGGGDYGRLTVHAAQKVTATRLRDVPPGAFDPPPKVDSTVVILTPHPSPPFAVADEALWRAVVDGSFAHRRKTLRNTVPAAVAGFGVPREEALEALDGMDLSGLRPEVVAPATFAVLVARLHEARA